MAEYTYDTWAGGAVRPGANAWLRDGSNLIKNFNPGDTMKAANSPGVGWSYAGDYSYQTTNPRSGSTNMTGKMWRYDGPPAPVAPPAPPPAVTAGRGSANDLPYPNDGSYDNVIGNINHQGAAGVSEADYWKQKQVDDAAAYAKQLDALKVSSAEQLEAVKAGSDQQVASLRDLYAKQLDALKVSSAEQLAAVKAGSDQQVASLRDLMLKQQTGFDQQLALQQQQLASSQAAYQEQVRQTNALSRAYIPTAEATATAPALGDSRTATTGSSYTNNSTLSSLSILSDASLMAPSLVGLQIA